METTYNALTPEQLRFFDKVRRQIELPLYFYGSVQRVDYISGKSDIDVMLFSDDEHQTAQKLQAILSANPAKVKQVIIMTNGRPAVGFKVPYTDHKTISAEFSVYNRKHQQSLLRDRRNDFQVPLIISTLLLFLKWIYYQKEWISSDTYVTIKNGLLNLNKTNLNAGFLGIGSLANVAIDPYY
jgi:hypothetical protein